MSKTVRTFGVVHRQLVERKVRIKPDYGVTELHVAVDVQEYYLDNLSSKRKESFPRSIREFADSLSPIPTLWIVFKRSLLFDISVGIVLPTPRGKNEAIKMFGLEAVDVREEENIFSKSGQNAFEGKQLRRYLKQKYPNLKNLIVTGMRTSQCVASTIIGGIENDYFCYAIYDQMAQTYLIPNEKDPLSHKLLLEKTLKKRDCRSGYEIIDSKSFLAAQKKNPAPAVTQMPGSRSSQLRLG